MAKSKGKKTGKKTTQEEKNKFTDIAQKDAALAPPSSASSPDAQELQGLTTLGKIALFLGFPTIIGLAGLYTGYLTTRNDPDKDIKFDRDFAAPFVLALFMVLVIGFQTNGFTSSRADPLIQWPKVKKQRRVVHKHVIVDEDGNEIEINEDELDEEPKAEEDKKND